jgi:hypothetical protein
MKINPVSGCAGRGGRETERDLQAKNANRTVCFHIIYQEMQLCGRIPRERVNHVYFVSLWLILCSFALFHSIIALLG